MAQGQYYWCLKHRRVEPFEGCKALDRLGPYPTMDDAAHALDRVKERNERWDNDPRYNDADDDK